MDTQNRLESLYRQNPSGVVAWRPDPYLTELEPGFPPHGPSSLKVLIGTGWDELITFFVGKYLDAQSPYW